MQRRKPVVALVGRPNVGKSTLFNRLIGRPIAIVEDIPGTTRDRIYGDSDWNGVGFIVIDTGGLEAPTTMSDERHKLTPAQPDSGSAQFVANIQSQARLAIDEADAIILVVDGRDGMTAADEEVAEVLRLAAKPVFLAVNKAEGSKIKQDAVEFWNLGLGEPYPISAYHGDGVGDLLDELVKVLPAYPAEEEESDTIGIAIVGRPNVGKSSLLNALIGHERAIVSDVPGTTRDPIDMEINLRGAAAPADRHGGYSAPRAHRAGHRAVQRLAQHARHRSCRRGLAPDRRSGRRDGARYPHRRLRSRSAEERGSRRQ